MELIIKTISDDAVASSIRTARNRVYATPGVTDTVASALIEARDHLGRVQVRVVLDGSANALRLGYGAETLVKEMKLDFTHKGVTYETLASGDFQEKVRDAFPYEDWDKPFSGFTAARAVQMSLPEHC